MEYLEDGASMLFDGKVAKISLVLLFFFIFSVQQGSVATQEENAATHYVKAIELLKQPKEYSIKDEELDKIIKEGIKKEDPRIAKLLQANEPALQEFRKGASLKKCDFWFGKPHNIVSRYPVSLIMFRALIRMALLKGRFFEGNSQYGNALDCYIASFDASQHVAQAKDTLISYIITIGLVKDICLVVENSLNADKLPDDALKILVNYLERFEKNNFTMIHIIQIYKAETIGYAEVVLHDKQFDWKKNPKWWLYEKSVLAIVHTLVEQYYGNYLKALETNNVSDWKFAEKEMKLLKKETVNEVKNKRKVAKKTKQEREMDELVQCLSGVLRGGGGDELLPSDIFVDKNWSGIPLTAKVIVVYLLPNFSAEKINYDLYLKQLQELKTLAKAKMAK